MLDKSGFSGPCMTDKSDIFSVLYLKGYIGKSLLFEDRAGIVYMIDMID